MNFALLCCGLDPVLLSWAAQDTTHFRVKRANDHIVPGKGTCRGGGVRQEAAFLMSRIICVSFRITYRSALNEMAITLPPETAKQLEASLRRYVLENLDVELDELPASMFLDYLLKEIGPSIYNQAISDAQSWLQARVIDLEGVCYEKEFGYWGLTGPKRQP